MARAVFLSNGEAGHMVPNQYWVPGMGSPMPIMGKYYVYYGGGFITPQELGRKNVERMVYELVNDNTGMCRFHRKWSEPLMPVIIDDRFGLDVDFREHHFNLAREINEHEKGKSVPWETERMGELFFNYLEACEEDGTEEPGVFRWHHHEDKLLTAQAFWQAIKDAQELVFRGPAEQIPAALTPTAQRDRIGP
jgi:glyceraldehyde-3-phosphate dehydrogenase (ferredoxin)